MDPIFSHTNEWTPPPLNIPQHWRQLDFEDAFVSVAVATLKIPQKKYLSSGIIPIVDQGAELIGGYTNDESKCVKSTRPLIVFGDHTKRFKLVDFPFAPGADGVKVLKPTTIDERFAYYACQALRLPDRGYSRHYSFLKKSKIPLAPRKEQHRIVAKIDELFSELDKGIESLKTGRKQLEVYRQSVLKHAFEGKLTAQWRAENKDKLETPEQLLARIKKERTTWYERRLQEWKTAVKAWDVEGRKDRKPPRPRKRKNPAFVGANPSRNAFWTQLWLDELAADSVLGKMLDRQKNSGIPRRYLGNLNLRWGKFDLRNLKTMKVEDSEIQRYSLAKGDLVICEGGEPGRCAVWEGPDQTMLIQKALHRVRFTESYSPYFAYYFMTYAASSGLLSPNFTGSTIKHLTGKGLGSVSFPLCTLSEQNQIVHLLDRTSTLCDELERQIEREIRRSDSLRQSVLTRAFSGQLVEQHPHDEPASVLLDRIRAEKKQAVMNNHSKKANKRKMTA